MATFQQLFLSGRRSAVQLPLVVQRDLRFPYGMPLALVSCLKAAPRGMVYGSLTSMLWNCHRLMYSPL